MHLTGAIMIALSKHIPLSGNLTGGLVSRPRKLEALMGKKGPVATMFLILGVAAVGRWRAVSGRLE